mmetsp:Transcript_12104/g.34024  ORF Transcript_12104/g.34024 Transcript_12104/m.34024 type:complete len:273 (+) Transcript_12104:90-908(+)
MAANIKPSEHQVAGHMDGDKAATKEDDQGRFYKPLQAGPRGSREFDFYELVKKKAQEESKDGIGTSTALLGFMPKYYGSTEIDGQKYIIVENINHTYKKPSTMDLKIGFHTWYEAEWNSEEWLEKRKAKDEKEGLGRLGFKLCGCNKWLQDEERYWKQDRDYWRGLAYKEPVLEEFKKFASNGSGLTAKDIYGAARPLVEEISSWFEAQEEYCFYGCSVLITYEGTATTADELNVSAKLIDFAHSFDGQGKKDENFAGGLHSVLSFMTEAMA